MCRPMWTIGCVHLIHDCCLSQHASQMRHWRLLPVTGAHSEFRLSCGGELVCVTPWNFRALWLKVSLDKGQQHSQSVNPDSHGHLHKSPPFSAVQNQAIPLHLHSLSVLTSISLSSQLCLCVPGTLFPCGVSEFCLRFFFRLCHVCPSLIILLF